VLTLGPSSFVCPAVNVPFRDLVAYLADFDLTLADLRPDQVLMFVAARNSARYVADLEVAIGSDRRHEGDTALTEREADRLLDLTSYDDPRDSHLPADEMDVSLTGSFEDLSRIFPVQWLLEEIQPDVFYVKAAQGELLMPQWQRPAEGPRDSTGEAPQRELVEPQAAPQSSKQHAYVLLDTSSTMRDRDRRGTVARGLALAFLRKGCRQRAQLNLRPFAAEVGPHFSGAGKEEFSAIARRIVELPNSGQTRIQNALEQAVLDIRNAGPCYRASIMLITDGISRLTQNPLVDEELHTFILGDLYEDKSEAGTIATLKRWSRTFHRIWENKFAEILAPAWPDCEAAGQVLQAALEAARANPSGPDAGKLARVAANVRSLLREFRRSQGKRAPVPPEVQPLEELVAVAQRAAPPATEEAPASADRQTPASGQQLLASGSTVGGDLRRDNAALWEYLKRLAIQAWNWTRQRYNALLRRQP